MMIVRLTTELREELRRRLLKKGSEIAGLLADVLAGKDRTRTLRELALLDDRPGERPEEKLRRYLNLVERCRMLLVADDDAYGRCDVCSDDLGVVALREMPWAQRCAVHAHLH